MPRIIRLLQLAWSMVSLQGFQSQRVRIPWGQFRSAEVTGVPMAYVLVLEGVGMNLKTGQRLEAIGFKQVALVDDPQRVADVLNRLAANVAQRNSLPQWDAHS
jgi:hypothetical protein